MAKTKMSGTKNYTKRLFFVVATAVLIGFIFLSSQIHKIQESPSFSKGNLSPTPTPDYSHFYDYSDYQQYKLISKPNLKLTENWHTYKNPDFGFEVKYPQNWRVSYDDYLFPQRALVSFISDNPYKDNAVFSIANPTKSTRNVEEWYQYISRQVTPGPQKLESEIINGLKFKKKFSGGLTCGTHYYLYRNGYIYEINLTTSCDEKIHELNDQYLVNILHTLRFTN